MQFVRLINQDHKPYDFHTQGKKRILQPGEEAMVPWDLACSLFGDPTLTDSVKEQARSRTWRQVAAIHNYEEGTQTAGDWRPPNIVVFDVETGQRVYMLLEDQDGSKGGYTGVTHETNDQSNVAALTARVSDLERLLAKSVEALIAMQQASPLTGQVVVASADAPSPEAPDAFPAPPTAGEDAPPSTPDTPVSTGQPSDQPSEDIPQTIPATVPHLAPRPAA